MFYYRPYARSTMKRPQQPIVEYTAETVWGAAALAHRVNGGYLKDDEWLPNATPPCRGREANKTIVRQALAHPADITDADRELGMEARGFLAQQLTLKTLKGNVSDFDRSLSGMVGKDQFTSADRLDIAVIASQIGAYERAKKELAMAERIDHSLGYLADVGGKVQARVEITRAVYSQNYGVYFISGVTDTNQAVFFSYRERHDVGTWLTIKGTVKAHRTDATQLSRVRVI
jgi:hypothetical protein